jgi:hypothetical protein
MRRIWPAPQVVWPARPQPWRVTPAPVRPDPRAALCPILLKPLRIPESLLGRRFLIRLKRRGVRECVHNPPPPQHLPDLRFLFLFKPLRVRRPFPRDLDRQVWFVLTDVPAGRARARALRVPPLHSPDHEAPCRAIGNGVFAPVGLLGVQQPVCELLRPPSDSDQSGGVRP